MREEARFRGRERERKEMRVRGGERREKKRNVLREDMRRL